MRVMKRKRRKQTVINQTAKGSIVLLDIKMEVKLEGRAVEGNSD